MQRLIELARRKGGSYTPPICRAINPDRGWFESKAYINKNNWHIFTWPTKKQCDQFARAWFNNYPDIPHPEYHGETVEDLARRKGVGCMGYALCDNTGCFNKPEKAARKYLNGLPDVEKEG